MSNEEDIEEIENIKEQIISCSSNNIDCPFRELGCAQGALCGEEMSGHLLQESRSHSEILIGTVANISRDMKMMKRELQLKDEQGKHLLNEMKLIKDENESMKIENESIKREKEVLCDQVRQLSEKLEREIDERRQSDERDTAMLTAIESNRDETKPVRDDIRSIRDKLHQMKSQVEAIRVTAGLEQLDDWLIDKNVTSMEWECTEVTHSASSKFDGWEQPYVYQLSSRNSGNWKVLMIYLRIWNGPEDHLLKWPFRGEVTVTVKDRKRSEVCGKQTQQCQIQKPSYSGYNSSKEFLFQHTALMEAGLILWKGVHISCVIVPDVACDSDAGSK